MKKYLKKFSSAILSLMIVFSSCLSVLVFAADQTTTETVTQSARELLKTQMRDIYSQVIDAGKNPGSGDALNSYITGLQQTGPWYVYGTAYGKNEWNNTTGFYRRADTETSLDLRYGYSYWSYTTPSVRVSYKDGKAANGEALTALLRPDSKADASEDRKNAYIGIYYKAEVSGEYYVSDNFGKFIVRNSDAEGYDAYITIYANGTQLYKSPALSRINRYAEFDGLTVHLEKDDKLEYRFTYEPTAEVYSGDIEFDFDPQIALISETEALNGTGEIAYRLYDELNKLEASGNSSVSVEQTAAWRAQQYTSNAWKDLPNYTNFSKSTDEWLDWGYDDGSYSQTDRIAIKYKNNIVSNGLSLLAKIPLWRWNRNPLRIAYTAERDGKYTLNDKYNEFMVEDGTLTVFDCWIQITHNGEEIWKSDMLSAKGDTVEFNGVSVEMKKGDTLAIEFHYQRKADMTEEYDTSSIAISFSPSLSYSIPETQKYSALDANDEIFADIVSEDGSDVRISGTLTQPDYGWVFKYGKSYDTLQKIEKYRKGQKSNYWDSNLLFDPDGSDGNSPAISRGTGRSTSNYGELSVNLRSRVRSTGIDYNSVYSNEFAYSFIAPYNGKYVLSQSELKLEETSRIPGLILRIYKNGTLCYSSDTLCNDNMNVTIPKSEFVLSRGEELIFFFERQDTAADNNWNAWMKIHYTPTVTYYALNSATDEMASYTPTRAERLYAENISVPVTVSAFIKQNSLLGGVILASDAFTLDIANHGYPRITLADKTEVIFPVDVRSEKFNHIAIFYDEANGKWQLYLNGMSVSTVDGANIASEVIEKLYVGASADKYNNSFFEGALAEVTLWSRKLTDTEIGALIENGAVDTDDTSLLAYWSLAEGIKIDFSSNGNNLLSETVEGISEEPESGLVFYNKNYRYDTYEVYDKPVNTVETWVKLDKNYRADKSAGSILSAYYSASYADYMQIDIGTEGNPVLKFRANDNTESFTFNTDLRTGAWLHLAIVADYDAGVYNCYVDGMLVDSIKTVTLTIPVTLRPYLISGQYFHNNEPINFEGELAGMKLYSDARTANEILDDIYSTDLTDTELLSVWTMDGTETGLLDKKGTNDLHPFWDDTAAVTVDETFGNYSTFVIIPDTQNFTQGNGAAGLKTISNWILDNKESENIVGVMGLGDITNNNSVAQWTDAKNGFEALKGQIPFVFVSGNHDIEYKNPSAENPRNVTNFNNAFSYDDWKPYMSGFFEEGKIDNMYYLLEPVNGVKYMLMGLEFMPRNEVLEWAGEVIAEHPDYKVLIAAHGYQTYSYIKGENTYLSTDEYNQYKGILGENQNTGEQMWEKLVSKYANIQAVFCGHVYHEDVHATTNTGINGNTVTEIIANAQTTDALMRASGTILILRVSEDGTKANINFYSLYHNHYLKDLNQFNIGWISEKSVCRVENSYYTSLEEAILAVDSGKTITLLENIELTEALTVSKKISIDTAGFTISLQNGGKLFKLEADMGYSFVNGIYKIDSSEYISDIDGNGSIDAEDLAYCRRSILGNTSDGSVYDINGDGIIDILDFVRMKKLLISMV